MKTHLNLVSPRSINPHRPRAVCGTHAPGLIADYMRDVTCRRCLQSAARLIDDGMAQVSPVWRMHKDKTRTLVREELALLPANVKDVAAAETNAQPHQTASSPSPRSACCGSSEPPENSR